MIDEHHESLAAALANELLTGGTQVVPAVVARRAEFRVPLFVTDAGAEPRHRILACNPAACELTGYREAELVGRTPAVLQGPATDWVAAKALADRVAEQGYGQGVLVNYRADGRPYLAEIVGVLAPAAPDSFPEARGPVCLVFKRRFAALVPGEEEVLTRALGIALRFEAVIQRYRRLMNCSELRPAQWTALRYFDRAGPAGASLGVYAREALIAPSTASSTVQALTAKGYLAKEGFRGAIRLTAAGQEVLQHDPLLAIGRALLACPEQSRVWSGGLLERLSESLDGELAARAAFAAD